MKSRFLRFVAFVIILAALFSNGAWGAKAQFSGPVPQIPHLDNPGVQLQTGLAVDTGQPGIYLLRLKDPPLASYRGEIPGYAATNPGMLGQRKVDPNSRNSLAYRDYLLQKQNDFIQRLEEKLGHSVMVEYHYYAANNGLALYLSPDEADQARQMPEVAFIQPNFTRQLDTDVSPAWIGATTLWDGTNTGGLPGTKGEGIIVGVIDTGINPSNPSFAAIGGDGYNHINPRGAGNYLGVCDPANASYDPTFPCNDKLIGAWGYASVNSGNPRDYQGHGSHTSSTAAGNAVTAHVVGHTISIDRQISGVAPHANIVMYAACCVGDSLSAAIDQIVLDGVDVVNYSIGSASPSDTWNDFDTIGFLSARDAGVFVSASAGNNGPGDATVGGPGDAPWLMSSAAASHNRKSINVLMSMSGGNTTPPADITGTSFTSGYGPAEIVYAGNYGDPLCLNPFTSGIFSGQIVICDRGTNARVDKGSNVLAGGAGGFILANDISSGTSLVADNHYLPAVHITYADGVKLKAWVADGGTHHTGTIRGTQFETNNAWGDILTDFSSRGPDRAVPDIVKPNITGPGEDVLAAGGVGDPNPPVWELMSGTSMASPHGAGSAALMVALHPTWTPDEIQSALMMTAWQGVQDYDLTTPTPFDMGSGREDLTKASKAGLVMNETKANYDAANPATGGDPSTLNIASLGKGACYQTCTWTRTFISTASAPVTWIVDPVSYNGMDLTVSPSSFTIPTGGTQTLTVNADVRMVTQDKWAYGQITLTPDDVNIPTAHLPVAAFAKSGTDSNILTKTANIDLALVGDTIQYTVTLTHKSLTAKDYSLSDTIPANTTYVSGSATGGITYNSGTNTLSWSGTMPAGTFTIAEGTKTGFISMGDLGAPPVNPPSNKDSGCIPVTLNNLVYFGTTYTTGMWSVNGTLQAGNTVFCAGNTNGQVPSTSQPNNLLAAYWDDLDFTNGGQWYFVGVTWNGKPHTVFSWENVPIKGTTDTASFQIWFEEGADNIWYTYKVNGMPAGTPTATIGAENSSGNTGATYYYYGGSGSATGKMPDGSKDLILGPIPQVKTFTFSVTANATPQALNQATLTQGSNTYTAYDFTRITVPNTWIGNTTSWGTTSNWSRNSLPGSSDQVTIPTNPSGGQMPVLGSDAGIYNLTIQPGASLDLAGNKLTVEGVLTNNGTLKQTKTNLTANTASEFLHITSASSSMDKYFGTTITPTGGGMGTTTVQVKGNTQCTTQDPTDTVNRCFEITPGTAQTAAVRFYYLNSENDGQTPANVQVWHWSSSWQPAGATSGRGTNGYDYQWVDSSGINAYSSFALTDKVSGPTAIRLTRLNAHSDSTNWLLLFPAMAGIGLLILMAATFRKRITK